jgi:Zeta toxin
MPAERVFNFNINAEVDRLFDGSSLPKDGQPVAVILAGGPAAGKTTLRKGKYSSGYVLIDAADIFLSLSRGEFFPFPEGFEEPIPPLGTIVSLL